MFSLNFYNNYGLLLNDKPFYQVLFVILFFIVLSSNNITDFFLLSVINILGVYMIFIIKEELKTTRPVDCEKDKIKYCPESYDIPSVLIEIGFLSNKQEEKKLLDNRYMKNLSQGLANAIENYLTDKSR